MYALTSGGNTPYNYFIRLADAFLHGRLYLTENPMWLSELIPAGDGRWFVPYSPMPALVSLPFVLLFGVTLPQQIIAHVLGAGVVVIWYLFTLKATASKTRALWVASLIGFGTILWFEAATGSTWYLGQVSGAFFLSLAFLVSQSKRGFLTGLAVGAAYLSRVHLIFTLPLFLLLLRDHETHFFQWRSWISKKTVLFAAGVAIPVVFNVLYNQIRFGVPWDKGYLLIPGVLDEPWFSQGIENVAYIPQNLVTAFWSFPKVLPGAPYIQPNWNGLAIWITTPAFLIAFRTPIKTLSTKVAWVTILAIFLFVLAHGSNGFTQFGYRFAIDFYPILIYLLATRKTTQVTKLEWVLLVVGIIVNTWGVLWINKFGWVSF